MKITDPVVIEAIADLILANRREQELGALGYRSPGAYGIPRVLSPGRAMNDGDHQDCHPVVAEAQADAQTSFTG